MQFGNTCTQAIGKALHKAKKPSAIMSIVSAIIPKLHENPCDYVLTLYISSEGTHKSHLHSHNISYNFTSSTHLQVELNVAKDAYITKN